MAADQTELSDKLEEHGKTIAALHRELAAREREFRSTQARLLHQEKVACADVQRAFDLGISARRVRELLDITPPMLTYMLTHICRNRI